jgi:hypothetical protein
MALRTMMSLMVAMAAATGLSAQTRAPESLLSKLLRIAGVTAAPSQMRGPGDEVAVGDIWIVNVDRPVAQALTTDGGYGSPIFLPNGSALLALRSDTIVRLSLQGGKAVPVQKVPGVLDAPAAGSPLAAVSLQSGKATPLPFDASSDQERRVLAQIRAQDRTYGDATVYTKTETKPGLSRPVEWIDVFLRRGTASPRNISACDGVNCVQPAMSADGKIVVFVKAQD